MPCLTAAPLPQPARHRLRLVPQPPQVHQVPHLHALQVAHHQDRSCWRCWRCSCWASSSTASPATWSRSSWGREGPAASPRRPSRACAFAPPLAWTFQTPWGASGAPVHPPGLGSQEPHCTSSPPQACCWRGPAPLVPACGWGVCPALLRHPPSSGPGSRGSHPKPPPGLPGKD